MIKKEINSSPLIYYVSEEKQEQAIMFVHAAFANHTQYDSQVEFFARNFTVITVDLIGHGASTKTGKGDGMEKSAAYIKAILTEERIETIHLVGVSLGAVIVQDFANKYPDNVASLCCFGGYDINNFTPSLQKENGKAQGLMMIKAMFSVKWFAKSNKTISAYTEQAQEDFYQMNIQFPKKSFKYLAKLNTLINKHSKTKRNYPLLIGCGEKDIPTELKAVQMWKESEPDSILVIIVNAGHLVNMDAPDEFNKTVFDFISN